MDENQNLEQQLLADDNDFVRPMPPQTQAPDPRLAGVTAPVLDDFGADEPAPKPQSRYQYLTAEQIALLQQQRAEKGLPPYTEEEIGELQAEYIERQRVQFQQQAMAEQAAAQAAAASALLGDDDANGYQEPEKKAPAAEVLPQVDAGALLEEAAPEPERKVTFNQEDLEAAKRKAVKSAASTLSSEPKTEEDAKRARQQLEALRQQQLADQAQAGFRTSIILTIIGMIAAACMVWFSARPYPEDFSAEGFFSIAGSFYKYVGCALVLLSFTIVLRVQALKGLTSFLFGVSSVLLLIPGIVLLIKKHAAGGFPLTVALFMIAIVGCFAVTFVISTSDSINAYYARKEIMYD